MKTCPCGEGISRNQDLCSGCSKIMSIPENTEFVPWAVLQLELKEIFGE